MRVYFTTETRRTQRDLPFCPSGDGDGQKQHALSRNLSSPAGLIIFVSRRLPANKKMNISVVSESSVVNIAFRFHTQALYVTVFMNMCT
jgi:hypothetical protein